MTRTPTRSLARRLVMATAVLALLALALLYSAVYWVASEAITRTIATTVDTDLAGLADIHASGGRDELVRRIADREQMVGLEQRRAWYMLTDSGGQRLAGTVEQWPKLNPALSEQGYVLINRDIPVYARATRLQGGLQLLVAREHRSDSAFLRQLSWTFAGVAGAVLLAAVGIGHWASRRLLRRIASITLALQRGDAASIEADPSRHDEIGFLAQTSAELIARADRLAEMHRHMSDHVAHEVRTPLMHLDQRLVAAQRQNLSAEDISVQLEEARRDIRRIAALLDSLLDIAANEARRGDPAGLTPVNLSELGMELAELYQGSMEEAGIGLQTNIAPDVVIQGEPMQLTRLLSNLLDNAIKYVPAGGIIRLSVSPGPIIEVADDGPGIAPELRPFLFERFRRGAIHHPKGGHGLGLALARAICERHGLIIGIDETAKGAHFVIQPEPAA